MTSERDAGSREIARWLREELARIRTSEAQVEQALHTLRSARRRVEEIALSMEREDERVRALVREEIDASGGAAEAERPPGPAGLPWRRSPDEGWARPSQGPGRGGEREPAAAGSGADTPPAAAPDASDDAAPDGRRERRRVALVALAAAVAVVVVGWLAFQGLREGVAPDAVVMAPGEDATGGEGVGGDASPAPGTPPGGEPLATLPGTPAAQVALYDSLFEARSPLFEPLLDSVAAVSDDGGVEGAVAAFREGDELSALERDAVHSSLVQWILLREIDQRVEIDGELLRNPCRGASCSALLNLWQIGGDAYGFPEVPDDAPTNSEGLRTVEAMLVLERMQDLRAGAGASAGELGG